MSGYTMSQTELIYSFYGAATVSTPTVSPGSSMLVGAPPIIVPSNYMAKTGSQSSSLKLKMGGLLTATATIPTFQFFLYASVLASPAAFASTLTVISSTTITPSAQTNAWWDLEVDIGLRTLGAAGANSTIAAWGKWECPLAFAAPYVLKLPNDGAYSPLTTWDSAQTYTLWPALSLGAATAGNTVTTEFCKLYGEN
jgi:hypothetical protein